MDSSTFSYSNEIEESFEEIFGWIEKTIDPEPFHNGTGYFNDLCLANFPDLEPVKFVDNEGRRGIVIPVKSKNSFLPNWVFFERYSNSKMIISQHSNSHDLHEVSKELSIVRLVLAPELKGPSAWRKANEAKRKIADKLTVTYL